MQEQVIQGWLFYKFVDFHIVRRSEISGSKIPKLVQKMQDLEVLDLVEGLGEQNSLHRLELII